MKPYDIPVTRIDGTAGTLAPFRGQVLLIVNVASECGYTVQYAALEALYRVHKDAGFAVLGFPCDQFGHQEPGTDREISAFCSSRFDVTFPMFGKVEVNGDHAHPFYRWLKAEKPGILGTEAIKWNFTKFLVARDGTAVKRYGSTDRPDAIGSDVLVQLRLS